MTRYFENRIVNLTTTTIGLTRFSLIISTTYQNVYILEVEVWVIFNDILDVLSVGVASSRW